MKILLLVAALAISASAFAQTSPPENPQPQPPKSKRIFGIIPAYDVAKKDAPFHPLSSKAKFRLFAKNNFDPFTVISAGFDAGINQATNTPSGYGQGGEGYAKRFGAAITDSISSGFFKTYMFPSLLHQDPRYFAMTAANGATKRKRFQYAVSRVFVTRGDNGKSQFNYSEVMGTAASASLVNVWYPSGDRDAATTFSRIGGRLGSDMGSNLLKEFWSEISRKIKLTKKKS